MPPNVPRKRLRSRSPRPERASKQPNGKAASVKSTPARKTTVFDDLETTSKTGSAEKTKAALRQMQDDEDDSSSLTSLSDAEFEDVPAAKRQKVDESEDEDDEDLVFEDVPSHAVQDAPMPSGDLEITFQASDRVAQPESSKRGPTKQQKQIRVVTHCMHVQFLLWHNAVRNAWLCDEEVKAIMISHLPPRLWDEVDRWRLNSGLVSPETPPKKVPAKASPEGSKKGKGKAKQVAKKPARDWGESADRLEKGIANLSHGDPLLRLMKALTAWWKQRFRITAPGLRKWGYMDLRRLRTLGEEYKKGEHDTERHGERIKNIEDFRQHAQACEGSRDVGAQLFTALLRGIGLEARMVSNLQSLGFGWSKAEEADPEKPSEENQKNEEKNGGVESKPTGSTKTPPKASKSRSAKARPASRRAKKGDKDALVIDLDDSDEYAELVIQDSDEDSIIDVTESFRKKPPLPQKLYDKDLEFPHYWTEVLSPVTSKYLPVDPIVKSIIGTSRELVEAIEPRGGKADKAKQILAYVVGFSQDGTAKDVTVRYLRKQLFPGRAKPVRMPVEKVPIYNRHGKVKRYDEFDWFRSVMRGYTRGSKACPITDADEAENRNDLTPALPEKKEVKEGEETLQYYKTSQEFVLERHLKREEALLPHAEPVKKFRNKGKGGKVDEEDVYLRKDIVAVKSMETWHKQGRAPIPGARPLKTAPYRAATTNRRREIAEAEAATGHKVMQPLYSFEQTDWIIPDPIKDGVIPKNEYGNIDMFAEHMCPQGAVHVPYRGCVKVCKRLGIDYAEAVTGFEFGHRMAVPVIEGVVVAEEHYERVIEELEKDEAERIRKADEKRRKEVLSMWKKFIMGLRIADRIRQDYGHLDENVEVFGHEKDSGKALQDPQGTQQADEDMAGGFMPEGYEDEEADGDDRQTSSYFPALPEDDDGEDPFEVEHGLYKPQDHMQATVDSETAHADALPEAPEQPARSTTRSKSEAKPRASTRSRRRQRLVQSSAEEDEGDDDDAWNPSDGD